jgi:DNA-directed RNA polymerase specialized sigma24 family protein
MGQDENRDPLIKHVRSARSGDERALDHVLTEAHVHISRFLRFWLHERWRWGEFEQDLAQEALVKIARGLKAFSGATDKEFLGWCRTVARNQALDRLRAMHEEWEQTAFVEEMDSFEPAEHDWRAESIDGQDEGGLSILLRIVRDVHAKESCESQALLWGRLIQSDGWADTGTALGITESAAKRRYQRTQHRLKVAVLRAILNLPQGEFTRVRDWLRRADVVVTT